VDSVRNISSFFRYKMRFFLSIYFFYFSKRNRKQILHSMENKINLTEKEIPTHWYNIQADMPNPMLPPLHPGTKQPVGPEDLSPIFPMELIKQEVSQERWIEIPEEVRDIYKIWRPTPMFRAHRLEKTSRYSC
jgi:predicted alternative tryptophan synthase beta-subunit